MQFACNRIPRFSCTSDSKVHIPACFLQATGNGGIAMKGTEETVHISACFLSATGAGAGERHSGWNTESLSRESAKSRSLRR